VPVLHQHIGRDHGPTITGRHQRRVVAGSEQHRSGLSAPPHQSIDYGELTELLQRRTLPLRPLSVVAHSTSSAREDGRTLPELQ
jgi:hypothetical protein